MMPWCSLPVSMTGRARASTYRLGRRVQCSPSVGMVIACKAHWPSLINGLVDPTWSASSNDPPGLNTLAMSFTPARGSGKPHSEKVHTTASKDSSPKGSCAPSACSSSTSHRAVAARLLASCSMPSLRSAPHRNLEDLPHRPFAHPPAARHQITLLHPCHPLVVTSRGSVPVTPHSFRSHGFRVPDVPAERQPPRPGINTCAHRLSETQTPRSAIHSGTMSRDGPAIGATRPALVWSGHRARGIPETRRIRSSSTVGKAHITGTRRTSPSFQAVPIRRQSPCFSALEGWRDFGSPAAEHRAALDFTR